MRPKDTERAKPIRPLSIFFLPLLPLRIEVSVSRTLSRVSFAKVLGTLDAAFGCSGIWEAGLPPRFEVPPGLIKLIRARATHMVRPIACVVVGLFFILAVASCRSSRFASAASNTSPACLAITSSRNALPKVAFVPRWPRRFIRNQIPAQKHKFRVLGRLIKEQSRLIHVISRVVVACGLPILENFHRLYFRIARFKPWHGEHRRYALSYERILIASNEHDFLR